MITGLILLFWLSVIILLVGLGILVDNSNETGGQILFFVGLAGMFMFGMSYIIRSNVEDDRKAMKQCSEVCGGQYIKRDSECFCVKGYLVKQEKENQ